LRHRIADHTHDDHRNDNYWTNNPKLAFLTAKLAAFPRLRTKHPFML